MNDDRKAESITGIGTDKPRDIMPTMISPEVLRQAFENAGFPPEKIKWLPAPERTEWGDGMMVADVAITKDETLTMYAHKDALAQIRPHRAVGADIGVEIDLPERVIDFVAQSAGIPGPFGKRFYDFCHKLKEEVVARMPSPPQGEVVVTTNAEGDCVAVTRQDADHRILSTIWTKPANPIWHSTHVKSRLRLPFLDDDQATKIAHILNGEEAA